MVKRVLLGIHDSSILNTLEMYADAFGYEAQKTDNVADMLRHAQAESFDAYIMDPNLDNPKSLDITPAQQIYRLVEEQVRAGTARFLAISGSDVVVQECMKRGIPAAVKMQGNFLNDIRACFK